MISKFVFPKYCLAGYDISTEKVEKMIECMQCTFWCCVYIKASDNTPKSIGILKNKRIKIYKGIREQRR